MMRKWPQIHSWVADNSLYNLYIKSLFFPQTEQIQPIYFISFYYTVSKGVFENSKQIHDDFLHSMQILLQKVHQYSHTKTSFTNSYSFGLGELIHESKISIRFQECESWVFLVFATLFKVVMHYWFLEKELCFQLTLKVWKIIIFF